MRIRFKGPKRFGPTRSFSTAPQIFSLSVTRARVGSAVNVTIRGANFRNCPQGTSPQVKFGGLSAINVVVVDQFTITATTPVASKAGLVDVTITTGCCA